MDYHLVLANCYKGKQYSMNGNSYDGLVWFDESPKPTEEEIVSKYQEAISLNAKTKRIAEIKTLLYGIDLKSIRPLRDNEIDRLAELEGQANTLRQEMRALLA